MNDLKSHITANTAIDTSIPSPLAASKAVVVLGMHRSGTSVITKSLEACGVFLGNKLVPGQSDNEKGFFEDAEVNQLNEQFLSEIGCTWNSIFLPDVNESLVADYIDKGARILNARFSGATQWALKEPRITRLPFIWEHVFVKCGADVQYILANRHPFSVADSLKSRNNLPRRHSLVLWVIHQAIGLRTIAKHGGIVVDYDCFIDDPFRELYRISNYIGSHPVNSSDFTSGFLENRLRHSNYSNKKQEATPDETERLALNFYNFLRQAAQGDTHLVLSEVTILLAELDAYLVQNRPWLEAIDQIAVEQIRLAQEVSKLRISNDKLHDANRKLKSELEWIEGRFYISWFKSLVRLFNKSGVIKKRC
jgi:hypothetical protein